MGTELAATGNLTGWRQHDHLWKKVKSLSRKIDRIALKKGPNYVARMKVPYRELLQKAQQITARARQLCLDLFLPTATENDLFGPHTLQAFIARTERVMDTAKRRVLLGETVPNSDKLFSRHERFAGAPAPKEWPIPTQEAGDRFSERIRASYAVVQAWQSGRARSVRTTDFPVPPND